MPAAGGTPRILVDQPIGRIGTMEFALSPDGRSFVYTVGDETRRIWRASSSGDHPQPITQGQGTAPSWSPDGTWIYFTTFREAHDGSYELERPGLNIWRVPSDGGVEVPVTNLTGRRGFLGPTIATDGGWLYFTWREDVSDIWTIDVVRQ